VAVPSPALLTLEPPARSAFRCGLEALAAQVPFVRAQGQQAQTGS